MRINKASRVRITGHVEATRDLGASVMEVRWNGQWYPTTWDGPAVTATGRDDQGQPTQVWRRSATTTAYFAGPEAPQDADSIPLQVGHYPTPGARVVTGTEVLVVDTEPVDVR